MNRPDLHQRLAEHPLARVPVEPLQTRSLPVLDFAGSDYLGLARHFQVLAALQDGAARLGMQAGACSNEHQQLEGELAQWLGFAGARSFQSLALARQAIQQVLLQDEDDLCLHDHLNVPALGQATRLAGCRLRHYPHRDAEGAAWQLRSAPRGLAVVATEGLFQADGQLAPLRTLSLAAERHQAHLLVDDAHAIGVCGDDGAGSLALAGLPASAVTALVISLEHAFGLQGAVVLGDTALIEHLDRHAAAHDLARPATAVAAAARVAVRLARRDGWRRQRVAELGAHLHQQLQSHGIASERPAGPLLCLELAGEAGQWQAALARRGLRVACQPAGHDPAAPLTRLRLQLSALLEPPQVEQLAESLARLNDSTRLSVPLVQPLEA